MESSCHTVRNLFKVNDDEKFRIMVNLFCLNIFCDLLIRFAKIELFLNGLVTSQTLPFS